MGGIFEKPVDELTADSRAIFSKCTPELWPYVWAINDPECLDWKKGKTESFASGDPLTQDDIVTILQEQGKPLIEISKCIYISDYKNAQDIDLLKEYNIKYILNLAGSTTKTDKKILEENNIEYLEINSKDEEDYPILEKHWKRCRQFMIKAQTREKRCLVHCVQGINRSGVMVAAHHLELAEHATEPRPRYLPRVTLNVLEVVAHCRRKRGNQFLWNRAFVVELVHMAASFELLGPKPGDPGCIVSMKAPPYKEFKEQEQRRIAEEGERKRKILAQKINNSATSKSNGNGK